MAKNAYSKQIKSFDDQISILKSRGMVIKDEARAKQILQNISYYRLSGYWYPLWAFLPGGRMKLFGYSCS